MYIYKAMVCSVDYQYWYPKEPKNSMCLAAKINVQFKKFILCKSRESISKLVDIKIFQ